MNFNKEIINHINGKTIEKTVNGVKELGQKITDELSPGTSKDISKGLSAEDSMGRASFSMLKKSSQFELSQKVDTLTKRLKFDTKYQTYDIDKLKNACSRDGMLDEQLVSIAEEFTTLGEKKPKEQQFCWEGYVGTLVDLIKDKNGIKEDVYSAVKTLLKDDKISTRGIDNIIEGCTEWIVEGGKSVRKFNKRAFEKYKGFIDINGKTMHEQDDVFTLYAGEAFSGATRKDEWLREGEENIFDEVAFNFAQRMYEQGEDILHMKNFLKSFQTYTQGKSRTVCDGFRFEAENPENNRWAQRLIETLKTDIKNEDLIEACKVDGKDSLHNLLVADTMIRDGRQSRFLMKYMINDLKDAKGYARTDIASYLLRKEGEIKGYEQYDIKKCLNGNGSINGEAYRKVLDKKINADDIDIIRVDGEINFDNLDILEKIYQRKGDAKYTDYQRKDVFKLLRNKDGIVEESMLDLVDEFKKYTHLAVDIVGDCMSADRVIDKQLLEFKKELCEKGLAQFANRLCKHCKNPDGTANMQGIEAVKTLLNAGLDKSDWYIDNLIPHFTTKDGINMDSLKSFAKEYNETSKEFREPIMWQLINYEGNKFSIENFQKLKSAMADKKVSPLMKDYGNATIVKSTLEPLKVKNDETNSLNYILSHLLEKDVKVLEESGFPAKFYKEAGKATKYSVDTSPDAVSRFETEFVKGNSFESKLSKINVDGDIKLNYTREELMSDIEKELEKVPEDLRYTIERAFKIERGANGIEGFPQRFTPDTTAPNGMEESFKSINGFINKFYSSEISTNNQELKELCNEITSAFPEFKMITGNTNSNGERIDIKTLKQLKELTQSPEYKNLNEQDKGVAKLVVLLNSLEHINSKSPKVKRVFHTDNDGIMLNIDAEWSKKGEYANSVIERFNLSETEKYRVIQLLEDIGWAKKLEKGELTPYDIAINQRYKGDEKVSPLIEKIVTGECKYDASAVEKEAKEIHKNQQVFFPAKIEELEQYIQTTIINGQELKYIDLDRPELKGKAFAAHFLGYDGLDHTLNIMRNRAYRSAFSASLIQGGDHSSCFAGRSTGIVFDFDNVNIANMHYTNIDSGFGKVYNHLKESMKTGGSKVVKQGMKDELHLDNDEYAKLMEQIVHTHSDDEITDCIINGKRITKEEIIKAKQQGIQEILNFKGQNESTILNPRPVATIGIGNSVNDPFCKDAVSMAQSNDMVMLFKRRNNEQF